MPRRKKGFDDKDQQAAVMALLRQTGHIPKRSSAKRKKRRMRKLARGATRRVKKINATIQDHLDEVIAAMVVTAAIAAASRGTHVGMDRAGDLYKKHKRNPLDPTRNLKGQFMKRRG